MWFPKCRTLSFSDIDRLCEELSSSIAETEKIDYVVSVERGGWYVGKNLSEQLNVPHFPITIGRFDENELRALYSKFPNSFKIIPIIWQHILFRSRYPKLLEGVVSPSRIQNKNILLVDDVVESGKSIRVARRYISSLNPASIRIASITNRQGSLVNHDCGLRKTYCYPWSRISNEYGTFKAKHTACHF